MDLSVLSLLVAIALLVGLFFWFKYQQDKGLSHRFRPQDPTRLRFQTKGVSNQTKRELRRLVNGNQALADRLVKQVRLHNPDRSEQWCWEKAVHDLQRDRRSF